jgi:hypothetical protein
VSIAATFFTTYEFLKKQLPRRFAAFKENPSLTHLVGSTGGEFVSQYTSTFFSSFASVDYLTHD